MRNWHLSLAIPSRLKRLKEQQQNIINHSAPSIITAEQMFFEGMNEWMNLKIFMGMTVMIHKIIEYLPYARHYFF